jgi:hypothetical protein
MRRWVRRRSRLVLKYASASSAEMIKLSCIVSATETKKRKKEREIKEEEQNVNESKRQQTAHLDVVRVARAEIIHLRLLDRRVPLPVCALPEFVPPASQSAASITIDAAVGKGNDEVPRQERVPVEIFRPDISIQRQYVRRRRRRRSKSKEK